MGFLDTILGKTKDIINGGKDVLLDQFSNSTTYVRDANGQMQETSSTENSPKIFRTVSDIITGGNNGYTNDQLKAGFKDSTVKDRLTGGAKSVGSLAYGLTDLAASGGRVLARNLLPGYSAYADNPNTKATQEQIDQAITDYLKPKNASEASMMKLTTTLSNLPAGVVGSVRRVGEGVRAAEVAGAVANDAGAASRISPIDRLIAENKVRVVSRDGRDVYQVKTGKGWSNARDEDSAIRRASPAPKTAPVAEPAVKMPEVAPSSIANKVPEVTAGRVLEQQVAKTSEQIPTPLPPERVATLEATAQQSAGKVLPEPPKIVPSLEKIVTQTPVSKKVNILDYVRTPDRVLNKIGFGPEAKVLRNQYEKYVTELPKNIEKISSWANQVGTDKTTSQRLFKYLDGQSVELNPTEQKVAGEIKAYLKEWADRLGLPEDNRVTHYITHIFDDQLIKKEFDEDLAKIISGKVPGQVYDPFLQKRLGAKGYKEDVWAALDAYTKRSTRKVHMDPALERIQNKAGHQLEFSNIEESQFKYIQRYVERVQMRPTELDNIIDNSVKQLVGYRLGQRPVVAVSRLLRRLTYRGMLGGNLGSALRNLSQGVNTYAVLGEKYTAIGYAKLANKADREELTRVGVLANNFIEDRTLSSTKRMMEKVDKGLFFFFDQAEKINRGAAYLGAKSKALSQGMSEEEAINYAKSIVRKTQFSFDPVDQPVALGSDIMKTLGQFQSYTTKQVEFLSEMLKDKNFVGLLRYAIAGTAFVYTVGKAFGMKEQDLLPMYRLDTPPSLKLPWEVVKALADAPNAYGGDRTTPKKLKDVGNAAWGVIPGGSQIKKTMGGVQSIRDGGSIDAAGRQQFAQDMSPLGKTQAILFGKYAQSSAQNYFNNKSATGNPVLDAAVDKNKAQKKEKAAQFDALYKEITALPKEEAKARILEIAKTDEATARKILDRRAEETRGLTREDKVVLNMGVTDGSRAQYLYEEYKRRVADGEDGRAFLLEMAKKKILTDEVFVQLDELKRNDTMNQ